MTRAIAAAVFLAVAHLSVILTASDDSDHFSTNSINGYDVLYGTEQLLQSSEDGKPLQSARFSNDNYVPTLESLQRRLLNWNDDVQQYLGYLPCKNHDYNIATWKVSRNSAFNEYYPNDLNYVMNRLLFTICNKKCIDRRLYQQLLTAANGGNEKFNPWSTPPDNEWSFHRLLKNKMNSVDCSKFSTQRGSERSGDGGQSTELYHYYSEKPDFNLADGYFINGYNGRSPNRNLNNNQKDDKNFFKAVSVSKINKKNFDPIDRSSFPGFVKKNFDPIDRSSFPGFVKKNFDPIDRSSFPGFVKRNFDPIDSSGLLEFSKKAFNNPLDKYLLTEFAKKNFDPIDSSSFLSFAKKNFDPIDSSSIPAFTKKNFDPIDSSSLLGFTKKNFDPIDSSSFLAFAKKNFDPIDSSSVPGFVKKKNDFDFVQSSLIPELVKKKFHPPTDGSGFDSFIKKKNKLTNPNKSVEDEDNISKRNFDPIDRSAFDSFAKRKINSSIRRRLPDGNTYTDSKINSLEELDNFFKQKMNVQNQTSF